MGKQHKIPITQRNILFRKQIQKKSKHCLSASQVTRLAIKRDEKMKSNFGKILNKLMHAQDGKGGNCLRSFLNMLAPVQQVPTSASCIPSIQNMISQQNIKAEEESALFSDIESFEANFSSRMIDDQNTDMSILYLCLLEKIMKLLHCHITPVQNFQVMKGTWNILVKYWRDIGYKCYEGVGNHVEWGLLELLNFDLSATPRERFEAEDKVQYFSEKEIC